MPEWAYHQTYSKEDLEPMGEHAKKIVLGMLAHQCIKDERWDEAPIRFVWAVSVIDESVTAGAAFEFEENK